MMKTDNNSKKKKIITGIGIGVLVLVVLGFAFFVSQNMNSGDAYSFTEINIDNYLEKMADATPSIIYIARPGCSWCQKESPIIRKIGSTYDLEIFYLNTDDFFDDTTRQYTESGYKFMASAEKYKDGWGTPNTIIVGNGNIIDGVFGYVEANELVELFKNNGFINE